MSPIKSACSTQSSALSMVNKSLAHSNLPKKPVVTVVVTEVVTDDVCDDVTVLDTVLDTVDVTDDVAETV